MTDTPPDWVLIEAAKRCGYGGNDYDHARWFRLHDPAFRALCDMIQKYEARPVDRKLLCAQEAYKQWVKYDGVMITDACYRAIELWEEGFGK